MNKFLALLLIATLSILGCSKATPKPDSQANDSSEKDGVAEPRNTSEDGEKPNPAKKESPEPVSVSQPVAAKTDLNEQKAERAKEVVDLLRLVDPKKNAIKGTWLFDKDALLMGTEGKTGLHLLEIPHETPEEFTLVIELQRTEGNDALFVIVPIDGHHTLILIDAEQGTLSGIHGLDNKGILANESLVKGSLLKNRRLANVEYTVRKNSLSVSLDGKQIINFDGKMSRLAPFHEPVTYGTPNKKHVVIGTFQSKYLISKLQFVPGTTAVPAPAVAKTDPKDNTPQTAAKKREQEAAEKARQDKIAADELAEKKRLDAVRLAEEEKKTAEKKAAEKAERERREALAKAEREKEEAAKREANEKTTDLSKTLTDTTTKRFKAEPRTLEQKGAKTAAYSPDGRYLATAGDSIKIWDLQDGKQISECVPVVRQDPETLYSTPKGARNLAFSRDGKVVYAHDWRMETANLKRSVYSTVFVFDSKSGKQVSYFDLGVSGFVTFSVNGELLVYSPLVFRDRQVELRNTETGKIVHEFNMLKIPGTDTANINASTCISPDNKHFLLAGGSYGRLYSLEDGKELRVLQWSNKNLIKAVFCPDGKRSLMAFGYIGQPVQVITFDTETGKGEKALEGNIDSMWSLAISADGKMALGGGEKTAILWNVVSGEQVRTHKISNVVTSVAISPKGDSYVVCVGGTVVVYEMPILSAEKPKEEPAKKEEKK